MTKRKGIVVLAFPFALVLATFVAREMREHPQAKQKNEEKPSTVPTPLSETESSRSTNTWLVVRNMTVERTETWSLSREETKVLVELAMDEVGNYGYDRNAPIQVEEERRFFTVTFPEPPHPGPPELICCADFAIKVRFDKTTRLVTEVECGG